MLSELECYWPTASVMNSLWTGTDSTPDWAGSELGWDFGLLELPGRHSFGD